MTKSFGEVSFQSLSAMTAAAVLANSLLLMGIGRPFSIQGILGRMLLLSLCAAGWRIRQGWKRPVQDSLVLRRIEQFLRWAR